MSQSRRKLSLPELYERARGAEAGSWFEIEDRVWPRVMGAVFREFPTLRGVDAEEVAQEALAAALKHRAEIPSWGRAWRYILRAARYQGFRALRRRERRAGTLSHARARERERESRSSRNSRSAKRSTPSRVSFEGATARSSSGSEACRAPLRSPALCGSLGRPCGGTRSSCARSFGRRSPREANSDRSEATLRISENLVERGPVQAL